LADCEIASSKRAIGFVDHRGPPEHSRAGKGVT